MKESLNIRNVPEIIEFFQSGGENQLNDKEDLNFHNKCHEEKINFYEAQDICIQQMSNQAAALSEQFAETEKQFVKVKIEKLDGTVDDSIDELFIDYDDNIETFKSYLLRITENQPFYFKHHMKNSEKISALL